MLRVQPDCTLFQLCNLAAQGWSCCSHAEELGPNSRNPNAYASPSTHLNWVARREINGRNKIRWPHLIVRGRQTKPLNQSPNYEKFFPISADLGMGSQYSSGV